MKVKIINYGCLLFACATILFCGCSNQGKQKTDFLGRLDAVKIIAVKCTIVKGFTTDILVKAQGEADIGVDLSKAKVKFRGRTVYLDLPQPDGYFPKLNESNTRLLETNRLFGEMARTPSKEETPQPESSQEDDTLTKIWSWTKDKARKAKRYTQKKLAANAQDNERELYEQAKKRIQSQMRDLANQNGDLAKLPIQNMLIAFYKNAGYKNVIISWIPKEEKK